MSEIISYSIASSILLAVFYLLYAGIFSRETFFQLNRVVLLVIPLLSLAIPLIHFDFFAPAAVVDRPLAKITTLTRAYHDAMASWEWEVGGKGSAGEAVTNAITWRQLLLYSITLAYFVGVLICLSKTIWSIRWVMKMLSTHSSIDRDGVKVVKLSRPTAVFSFFRYVFVYAPIADSSDFRQILDHERIHIQEKHTFDLLYVQLVAALFWFNPFIWQLLKSLKTTHEYIADRKTIQLGYSVSAYQTMLLRQLISNNSYELVHNFNLSFIKKRITMMTTKKSGWAGRIRVGIALVAVLFCSALIIQCNSKIEEQIANEEMHASSVEANVHVPTLPPSAFRFNADLSNALTFTISNNTLRIGNKEADLSDIAKLQGDEHGRKLPIVMIVDREQNMRFVRKVDMALREADRRKLLYLGKTASGARVEVSLVLPPHPGTGFSADVSNVPEERLLKIDLGENEGAANVPKVYDFVMKFLATGDAEYAVVSARISDDDTFESYLLNFFYVKEGYVKIYQERARQMFGKDFYETNQEEYNAVRERIPMNISIAEN